MHKLVLPMSLLKLATLGIAMALLAMQVFTDQNHHEQVVTFFLTTVIIQVMIIEIKIDYKGDDN